MAKASKMGRRRRDHTYRRRWLAAVLRLAPLMRQQANCRHLALLLAHRSDDGGKPVWGAQLGMVEPMRRCDRTIRRHLGELEELGLVRVERSRPERGADGRWCRRQSNVYVLTMPSAGRERPARTYRTAAAPQPPEGGQEPGPAPAAEDGPELDAPDPPPSFDPEAGLAGVRAVRHLLRSRSPTLPPPA
jgi:hypothetical protein